jgi:DNA topoisomerase-1
LISHFNEVLDYGFTAKVEQDFDHIANGNEEWKEILKGFYGNFHPIIEDVEVNAERANGERKLGIDPKTGKNVYARIGRFGPMIQIGESDDEQKPTFASLLSTQNIATISLELALDLFKIPFDLQDFQDKSVTIGVGRYGPYVKWGDAFISLGRATDPFSVTQEMAEELIREKQKADAPVSSYKGEPVTKGTGRFGPFIKYKDLYVNVPKKYDFENLTENEMHELIAAKIEKENNRYLQQWEKEKISIENGRWGPFVKTGKKMVKIPKKDDGEKYEAEELKTISLDIVKKWIAAAK